MRKKIVAGNWKMHGTCKSVAQLLKEIRQGGACLKNVETIVFPPYIFLDQTRQLLTGSNIFWGAQNLYQQTEGAFTGEISPKMLQEFGCTYALVGHSERRHLLGESNDQVAAKFIVAGKNNLTPILCVGETKEERQSSKTFDVIKQQLSSVLEHKEGCQVLLEHAIIAYEPVWAIGTGLTASPEQAQEVHAFIRQEIEKFDKSLAEKLCILYGGSVKQSNAAALFAMPDIDGGLIGGASLDAKEFLEIAKLCN